MYDTIEKMSVTLGLTSLSRLRPLPLVRVAEPFDHDQFVYELKHDGFRALAFIRGHQCELVSRRGHVYKFHQLAEELAHAEKADDAILDGEIVCLGVISVDEQASRSFTSTSLFNPSTVQTMPTTFRV